MVLVTAICDILTPRRTRKDDPQLWLFSGAHCIFRLSGRLGKTLPGSAPGDEMHAGTQPTVFATTRWNLVVASAQLKRVESTPGTLWQNFPHYWRPIFSFVSRQGHSQEDAQDLTQDFFVMVLKGNWPLRRR